jgi:aspartate racemase
MKTVGLLGGMTWDSTLEYYRILNEEIAGKLGGFHSVQCVIISLDFHEIHRAQHLRRWEDASAIMAEAGRKLQGAGADFIVICTNLMHKLADDVRKAAGIPLLHIVDVTAAHIKAGGLKRVGLLGSQFTMEEGFYRKRLTDRHGLRVVVPNEPDMKAIHHAVNYELKPSTFTAQTMSLFRDVISRLEEKGAEGIILGCTEIPLFIKQRDFTVPLFDTTTLHARAAAAYALGEYELDASDDRGAQRI